MEDQDVINTLNKLIETCKDGEYGFRSCSDAARRGDLRQLFASRAEDCRHAAVELQTLVRRMGGKAEDSGSAAGVVHRGWVAVKATLAGYTDLSLLEECERGEDVALRHYREALAEALPPNVLLVARQQFEGAQRNHAQIRMLRDEARLSAASS